jgi:hypothetical protein
MNSTLLRALLGFVLFVPSLAWAQDTVRVVLRGYDPVGYFTDGKPVRGDPKISYDWDESRYYFSTAKHRDMFAGDPDRYAPQFGGYCTGSMSRGVMTNEGHPEAWVISDGRLYVFGAKDSEMAARTRVTALNDPDYLRVRIPKAEKIWREKK